MMVSFSLPRHFGSSHCLPGSTKLLSLTSVPLHTTIFITAHLFRASSDLGHELPLESRAGIHAYIWYTSPHCCYHELQTDLPAKYNNDIKYNYFYVDVKLRKYLFLGVRFSCAVRRCSG